MIFAYTYSPTVKKATRDYKNILLHFYGLKPFKPSPSEALVLIALMMKSLILVTLAYFKRCPTI